MAQDTTLYRVFIASPGGLQEERLRFRNVLRLYNEAEAIRRRALFYPIGWEDTLAGVGRPQELINADIEKCDYLVLVLWDRWGSPTSKRYTSGVEEEYELAMALKKNQKADMRQVVVFFKKVEEQRLKDPGDQLKPVLAFKEGLEKSKAILFATFDGVEEFENLLRGQLANWLHVHEIENARQTWNRARQAIR